MPENKYGKIYASRKWVQFELYKTNNGITIVRPWNHYNPGIVFNKKHFVCIKKYRDIRAHSGYRSVTGVLPTHNFVFRYFFLFKCLPTAKFVL